MKRILRKFQKTVNTTIQKIDFLMILTVDYSYHLENPIIGLFFNPYDSVILPKVSQNLINNRVPININYLLMVRAKNYH